MGKSFLNTIPKAETLKGKHINIQPHAQKILTEKYTKGKKSKNG